jgi:hypothetical protein
VIAVRSADLTPASTALDGTAGVLLLLCVYHATSQSAYIDNIQTLTILITQCLDSSGEAQTNSVLPETVISCDEWLICLAG